MCGIWAFLNNKKDLDILFKNFMNIKHRGPNMSSFQQFNNIYIGFHRLAIMEPSFTSNQPYIIKNNDKTIVFICNGEIFNYRELFKYINVKPITQTFVYHSVAVGKGIFKSPGYVIGMVILRNI